MQASRVALNLNHKTSADAAEFGIMREDFTAQCVAY